jgi:hypothetical protein
MTIRALDFLLSGGLLTFLPLQAQSGDGVWRSRGCGDVYEIQGPTVRTYQVTSTTCFPGFTAQRDPATVAGGGRRLPMAEARYFLFVQAVGGTTSCYTTKVRIRRQAGSAAAAASSVRPLHAEHSRRQLRGVYPHRGRELHPVRSEESR